MAPMIPIGFPGQREVSAGGIEREYKLVVKHTLLLLAYVMLLIFPVLVVDILIIGPALGYAIIALGILYASARVLNSFRSWNVVVIGVLATSAWLAFGYDLVDSWWWIARCDWPLRNKLLFITWTGSGLVVLWLAVFRSSYEIVDPNWSPTISVRPADWGILWPWNQPVEVVEEEPESTQPQVEQLPRPVPNFGSRDIEPSVPTDDGQYDRVIAPSGRVVRVSTLLEFAALAPKLGTAFTGVWKGRLVQEDDKNVWDLDLWQDVVDTWALFGVVTERQERTKTRVLVGDPREAAARLATVLDVDSPTLP
jgi:hypothetical protein